MPLPFSDLGPSEHHVPRHPCLSVAWTCAELHSWDPALHVTLLCMWRALHSHLKVATSLLQPKCHFPRELWVTPKSQLGLLTVILSGGTMSF